VGEIFLMKAMLNSCSFVALRVLNKYHFVESLSAFSNVYDNTGLFGIYLTTVS
jgi:mitochondrial-processing peptidase subunit alpha